jgi:hypothetical protein
VSEGWVKTQLGPYVPFEDVKKITMDVNGIIKANPTEKQLREAIEIKKLEGGHDWGLTVLSLARSSIGNPLYNFV